MKAEKIGINAYLEEQRAKKAILTRLLKAYDVGQRDVFYCPAVNMLEVQDIEKILEEADRRTAEMSPPEKAGCVISMLKTCAEVRHIPLKLRH